MKIFGLNLLDWFVILFLLLLAVIIDPTDIFDFGLPILEPILATVYFIYRKKGGKI